MKLRWKHTESQRRAAKESLVPPPRPGVVPALEDSDELIPGQEPGRETFVVLERQDEDKGGPGVLPAPDAGVGVLAGEGLVGPLRRDKAPLNFISEPLDTTTIAQSIQSTHPGLTSSEPPLGPTFSGTNDKKRTFPCSCSHTPGGRDCSPSLSLEAWSHRGRRSPMSETRGMGSPPRPPPGNRHGNRV